MTEWLALAARRNETWAPTIDLYYDGDPLPLNGAHIAVQIKQWSGSGPYGAALLTANPVAFLDSAAEANDPGERRLRIEPVLSQTQMSGLLAPKIIDAGDSQLFFYDVRITYADGASEVPIEGLVVLSQGATQA